MGFFNERSLRIVLSASRYSQPPLHFPGIITSDSMNLQLTQSGRLRRIVIAAKFNATAHTIIVLVALEYQWFLLLLVIVILKLTS